MGKIRASLARYIFKIADDSTPRDTILLWLAEELIRFSLSSLIVDVGQRRQNESKNWPVYFIAKVRGFIWAGKVLTATQWTGERASGYGRRLDRIRSGLRFISYRRLSDTVEPFPPDISIWLLSPSELTLLLGTMSEKRVWWMIQQCISKTTR